MDKKLFFIIAGCLIVIVGGILTWQCWEISGGKLEESSSLNLTSTKLATFSDSEDYYSLSESVIFSPDGKRVAYLLENIIDEKYYVVLDGEKIGPYSYNDITYRWERFSHFSPDGKHFAFFIEKEGSTYIVLDGKQTGPYDIYDTSGDYGPEGPNSPLPYFSFSPDSKHFIYVSSFDGFSSKGDVILDGTVIGSSDNFEWFSFSPDSRRFAYYLVKLEEGGLYGGKSIILDGKQIGPYENIPYDPVFSPNSQHFAFVASKQVCGGASCWIAPEYIVLDGKEIITKYDDIYTPLLFDSGSKYLSYGARIGNELWWVVDKVEELK